MPTTPTPPQFNSQVLSFDLDNAHFFAVASDAAYTPGLGKGDASAAAAHATVAKLLGTTADQVDSFEVKGPTFGTEGYVAKLKGAIVLAFRGTETKSFDDWATDLNATPVRLNWLFPGAPAIGEVHAGFGHAMADSWGEIHARLLAAYGADRSLPLFITGHSLGGALAVLAATMCTLLPDSLFPLAGLYTYGQPRVVTHGAANTLERLFGDRHFRFVNYTDLVPRVPPRSFDYTHTGQAIHFQDPHISAVLEGPETSSFFANAIVDMADARRLFGKVPTDVAFHQLDSATGYMFAFQTYLELLKANPALRDKLKRLFP